MLFYIGADHRGYKLKETLKNFLKDRGYQVFDVGNANYDEQDDFTDFAAKVAEKVSIDYENSKGILICGSGIGVSIVANKYPRVRAGLLVSPDHAFDAKNDDNTNVAVFASDYVTSDLAKKILITWLEASFSEEPRFRRRIEKIETIEKSIIQSHVGRKEEQQLEY